MSQTMLGKTACLACLLCSVALSACGRSDGPTPTSTTGPSSTSPPSAPAPTPPSQATFTIGLPIKLGDSAHNAYGMNPFGVHLGDHGLDGHPGWDFEFIPGSNVYAAAEGTVQSVLPSVNGGITTWGIQIQHTVGGQAYRTIYGVGVLAPGVSAGAAITAGQTLGTAAVYTFTIGRAPVTFAMVHFQVDDFSQNSGLTNTNAVPPETFLDAESQRIVDVIFHSAAYGQELVEPFLANSRNTIFPQTRAWVLQQGNLAARIDFTRADGRASEFTYVLRDANGASLESGTATNVSNAAPVATIDFQPAGGGLMRRGAYDIVGDTMSMNYGSPGSPRPASLDGASTYKTQ